MKSIRIEKIADMVRKGMITADIGTDHAFLPILLIQKKIVPKAYACDVAAGPLQSARRNIAMAGLTDQIPVLLSDGLEQVPADVQTAVIAGMGFETAAGILEKDPSRTQKLTQIIVEVNRDTVRMRQWISDHHFTIDQEVYIREKNHDYTAVSFSPAYHGSYNEAEILFGPKLMQKNDPGYRDYLLRQKNKMEAILTKSNGRTPAAGKIRRELVIYDLVFGQKKNAVR